MKSIFISSTFRDFHKERDLLRNRIIPAVNQTAKEYGEFLNICDLRWGVDTSETNDSEGKVLSVCLDEIDRSRPYMMVFLGERYGYVPGGEYIEKEARKRGIFLEDLEISVTQLEIEYGVFHNKENLNHTWFYFREIEKADGHPSVFTEEEKYYQEKLTQLKDRIRQLAGDRVRFYKIGEDVDQSYDELCKLVEEDMISRLEEEWQQYAQMNPYEKDNHNQWNYLQEKAGHFKAGVSFADQFIEDLADEKEKNPLFILTGDVGKGKSTCFSHVCTRMQEKGWDVIPMMCGNTAISTDEDEILRSFIWQIEKLLNLPHYVPEEADFGEKAEKEKNGYKNETAKLKERLNELCAIYSQEGRKLLLAVDAIDQLYGVRDLRDLNFLPEGKSSGIRILLTRIEPVTEMTDVVWYEVPGLKEEDKRSVIDKVLYENGKQLASSVCDYLFKKKVSMNPLFLYLAVNHLCLMDEEDYNWIGQQGDFMEGTNLRQMEIVSRFSDDLNSMAAETLRKSARVMNSRSAERCIEYIAVGRRGLRTMDLENLLEREGLRFSPLEFSRLIHSMNELYVLKMDGRFDFMHKSLREGILGELCDTKGMHRKIAEYLMSLPKDDRVRQQELYYHLIQAGMSEEFLKLHNEAMEEELEEQHSIREEVYHQCMEDEGTWMLSIVELHLHKKQDQVLSLIHNLIVSIGARFRESHAGLFLYHTILKRITSLLEAEEAFTKEIGYGMHILCLANEKLGDNLIQMDTPETLKEAGRYFDRVIELRDRMAEKSQDVFTIHEAALAYQSKADWLETLGEQSNQEEIMKLYEYTRYLLSIVCSKEATITHYKNFALVHSRIAARYMQNESDESVEKALEYYGAAEEILREMVNQYPVKETRLSLARVLRRIGNVYVDLGSDTFLHKAITYYEEAYEILQNTFEDKYEPECIDEMIDMYSCLGFAYSACNEQMYLKKSFEHYEKGYKLAYEAAKSRKLSENYRDMIMCCNGISRVSAKMGEQAYLNQALEYSDRACSFARHLMKTNKTAQNIYLFLQSLTDQGEVYEAIGTETALEKAGVLYDEAIRLIQQLEEQDYKDISVASNYIKIYEKIGQTFERRGGIVNFKEALPYYEKAYRMELKMNEVFGISPERLRNLEISSNKIGKICIQLKEQHYLDRGREYIEKGLEIAEKLAREYPSDKYLWDLSYCYNLMMEMLIQFQEDSGSVQEYARKAFAIREQLYEKQKTPESRKTLSISYEKLIYAYRYSGTYQDRIKACEYVKKHTALTREIMEEEGTLLSKMDYASACETEADQYMELAAFDGRYVMEAEKQYKEAAKIWETMIEQIGTYRAYMNYCTLYGRMAHLYIMKGDEEKTEFCFQKSIEIGEAFLRTNPDGQYKGILADIYMEMASYYESKDTEEAKRKEADLYLKSLRIYEEIKIAEDDYRQKSNFAAICNGLAGVSMILEQYEDAVFYYKRNIQITEEIPYEFRDSRRVICHYSSYNRMAAIAVQNGNLDLGIEYLTKAIELEDQVLYNLKNQEDLLEILEDKIKDCGFVAAIYQSQGVMEKAEHYLLKEIEALTILEKSMPENYDQKLITETLKLLNVMFQLGRETDQIWPCLEIVMGLMHKYPEYKKFVKDICHQYGIRIEENKSAAGSEAERVMDMYTTAEGFMTKGRGREGLKNFEKFHKMLRKLPREEWNEELYIYQYNSYSQIAGYYANKNTKGNYKKAVEYFVRAVDAAMFALEQVGQERYKEIMDDMIEDCSYGISLSHRTNQVKEGTLFHEHKLLALNELVKVYPRIYEPQLAQHILSHIAFRVAVAQDYSYIEAMAMQAYEICQKYDDIDPELKEAVEEMMRMLGML